MLIALRLQRDLHCFSFDDLGAPVASMQAHHKQHMYAFIMFAHHRFLISQVTNADRAGKSKTLGEAYNNSDLGKVCERALIA